MELDREMEKQKVAQHREVLVTTWQSQLQLREARKIDENKIKSDSIGISVRILAPGHEEYRRHLKAHWSGG